MRKSESKGVFVAIERRSDSARIVVDSVDNDGRYINGAETQVTVIDPNLKRHSLIMQQSAPGRYEAEIETTQPGPYNLEINQSKGGTSTFRQSRGLVVGYPDELRLGPTNENLLRQISDVSGGRFDIAAQAAFDPGPRIAQLAVPLWPYLLMIAISLLVIDVALRRIDLSRSLRT